MPLRCGVIGVGRFGRHYVRLLRDMPGAELVAVAARTQESVDALGSLPDTVWKTTEVASVIQHPDIDCVIVATPAITHAELCREALIAGKHVLVEKPMVTTLEDAYAIEKIVKETGRTFMVGHQYLYNDSIRELRRRIQNNELGRIRIFRAEHFSPGPIRTDIGCLWEMATHELSILHYLIGPGELMDVRGRVLRDIATFSATFAGGLTAVVTVSWLGPEKMRRCSMIGEAATAVFDDSDNKSSLSIYSPEGERTVPPILTREPLRNEIEHFLDCVRTGRTPETDVHHGVRITEALDHISRLI